MHQPGASLGIIPSLRSLLRQEVWLSWTGSCRCTQSALDTSLCFSGLRGLLISEPFTQPGALPGLPHFCTHPPQSSLHRDGELARGTLALPDQEGS